MLAWTPDIEKKFIQGIKAHGCNWDKLREFMDVGLSNLQIRSKFYHYLRKMKRGDDVLDSAILQKAHEEAKEKYWTEDDK